MYRELFLYVRVLLAAVVTLGVVIVGLPVYFLVKPLSQSAQRYLFLHHLQPMWFRALASILPQQNLIRTGTFPKFSPERPCIIIANHQIDSDFFVTWSAFEENAGSIKIVLKDDLAKIPLIGFGIKTFDFLFLSRNYEKDKFNLR